MPAHRNSPCAMHEISDTRIVGTGTCIRKPAGTGMALLEAAGCCRHRVALRQGMSVHERRAGGKSGARFDSLRSQIVIGGIG